MRNEIKTIGALCALGLGLLLCSCIVSQEGNGSAPTDVSALPVQEGCKWGFMNKNKVVTVPPRFDEVGDFFDELARVRSGNKWGFIDTEGKLRIETMYDSAGDLINGYAKVTWKGRDGFINHENNFTALPEGQLIGFYDDNSGNFVFSEGLAVARLGKNYGYVDTKGNFAISPSYADARPFSEGSAWVQGANGFWTYIDKTGQPAFDPQYKQARDFHDGFAAVKIGAKWGFLTKPNRLVVPCKFDGVLDFHESRAAFVRDDLVGFIDESGAEVIVPHFKDAMGFHDGLAAVKGFDDKWSFVAQDGKPAFSATFDWVSSFRGGFARVAINYQKDGVDHFAYGLIDKQGVFVVPPDKRAEACDTSGSNPNPNPNPNPDPNPDSDSTKRAPYLGSWGANFTIKDSTGEFLFAAQWSLTSSGFVYDVSMDLQGKLWPLRHEEGSWSPSASGITVTPQACANLTAAGDSMEVSVCPAPYSLAGSPAQGNWNVTAEGLKYVLKKGYAPVAASTPSGPAGLSLPGSWDAASQFYDTTSGSYIPIAARIDFGASSYTFSLSMQLSSTMVVIFKESGSWTRSETSVRLTPMQCQDWNATAQTMDPVACGAPYDLPIDAQAGTLKMSSRTISLIFRKG